MKHLLTLAALLVSTLSLHAQIVDDYQPDSDGDGCVGMSDLLSLLSVFGTCELQAFACGDPISYQGYDYSTVQIGEQCWFAENLRSELFLNGDTIPAYNVAVYGEGAFDCLNYSPDFDACDEAWSLNEYGRMYKGYAVVDTRGLCPSGWHVPTDGEWMTMEMALGMTESEANSTDWRGMDQGAQMKSSYGWIENGNGINSSGFSGLPGGYRTDIENFDAGGGFGAWWSSSLVSTNTMWARALVFYENGVLRGEAAVGYSYSVRCIQDSEE